MGDLKGQRSARLHSFFLSTLFLVLILKRRANGLTRSGGKKKPKKPNGQPLRQGREVGKDVSRHHVQTRLCELQVDGLQPLVGLSHRVFIGGAQAAGGGRGVHPTRGNREEG